MIVWHWISVGKPPNLARSTSLYISSLLWFWMKIDENWIWKLIYEGFSMKRRGNWRERIPQGKRWDGWTRICWDWNFEVFEEANDERDELPGWILRMKDFRWIYMKMGEESILERECVMKKNFLNNKNEGSNFCSSKLHSKSLKSSNLGWK